MQKKAPMLIQQPYRIKNLSICLSLLNIVNSVYDKHAPCTTQRIKHLSKPKWFHTTEIQDAISVSGCVINS